MFRRRKERLDCTSAEGCGEKDVAIDRRSISLFLPPPGANRRGKAVFAVFECPLCSSPSKLRVSEGLLDRVIRDSGMIIELAQQGRPNNTTRIDHTERNAYFAAVQGLAEVPDPNTNLP